MSSHDKKPQDEKPIDAAFRATGNRDVWNEPAYSGALSAFRRRYTRDLARVDAVMWGVPLDLATSYRPGTRFGPKAIRAISAMWEPFDAAWPYDFSPFRELAVVDYGDAAWDLTRPETIAAAIQQQAATILKSGAKLYSLGGDHSITHPLVAAHAAHHGPVALIHFDAHPDTWEDGAKKLYHGNFLSQMISSQLIDEDRSIQIGLRTVAPPSRLAQINAEECLRWGVDKIADTIRQRVGAGKAYISFDIDVLDPAYAPGTGTPVPGGLSTREAFMILRGLAGLDIVGADLVEVSPAYDHAEITANAAAGVLQQLLCLQVLQQRQKKGRA